MGDPMDEKTELGPLATPKRRGRLSTDVQNERRSGRARSDRRQAARRPRNFYAPTVLTNIPKDSPAYSEEFFGPVACLFRAKDLDEAIRIANDTRFGLGASAWTNTSRSASA